MKRSSYGCQSLGSKVSIKSPSGCDKNTLASCNRDLSFTDGGIKCSKAKTSCNKVFSPSGVSLDSTMKENDTLWSKQQWTQLCNSNPAIRKRVHEFIAQKKLRVEVAPCTVPNSCASLPYEVWVRVFAQLSKRELLCLRLVCKRWNTIIERYSIFWKDLALGTRSQGGMTSGQLMTFLESIADRARSSLESLELHRRLKPSRTLLDPLLQFQSGYSLRKLTLCGLTLKNIEHYKHWLQVVPNIQVLELLDVDTFRSGKAFLVPLLYCKFLKRYKLVFSGHCFSHKRSAASTSITFGGSSERLPDVLLNIKSGLDELQIEASYLSTELLTALALVAPNIKHFVVKGGSVERVRWPTHFEGFCSLKTLYLGSVETFTISEQSSLAFLSNLTALHIFNCSFVDDGFLTAIALAAPHLERLLIPGCANLLAKEPRGDQKTWYELLPDLKHLDLSHCPRLLPQSASSILDRLPKLTHLYLSYNFQLFADSLLPYRGILCQGLLELKLLALDFSGPALKAHHLLDILKRRAGKRLSVLSIRGMSNFSNESIRALYNLLTTENSRIYSSMGHQDYSPNYEMDDCL